MAQQAERVGQRIEQERTKRGWSRPEMARRMPGVSTGNDVYRWETGKHVPRGDTLDAIADLFDLDVSDLYAGAVESGNPAEHQPSAEEAHAALSGRASEADLVEQVRATNSELAEVRGELSEVRTELQRVLSLLQRGERGQEESGS